MGATLVLPEAMTLPHTLARGQALLIQDGTIREIVLEEGRHSGAARIEGTLLPGFVDLQVNGSGGRGVDEGSTDALETVARAVWQGGGVAFLPTLITAPFPELLGQVRRVAEWIRHRAVRVEGAATPLGIHVEGPFLEVPGAHDEELFLDPTPERVDALIEAGAGALRLVTLASSRAGAVEAVRRLCAAGVVVALGHVRSVRGFHQCVGAGAKLVTHLFNAMGPIDHREACIPGLAMDCPDLGCSVIADGIHVHPSMVRNAFRCLGSSRTVLVTDAVAAAGMPDGEYRLGDARVELRDGAVRDRRGRLAGSSLTMARAARGFLDMVPSCGPWSLAQVASANPATCMGFEEWGRIAPGSPACFTILKPDGSMAALQWS